MTVPNVVGLRSPAAERRLGRLGLHFSVRAVVSSRPAGTVVAQRPTARVSVARGAIVRLSVSKGAVSAVNGELSVPDLRGELTDDAQQQVTNLGLVPDVVYVQSLQLVGTVIAQDPAAGTQVAAGTKVTISISSGPGP